jgi:hypothetical protein
VIGADCTGSCKFSKSNQNFITGDKVRRIFGMGESKGTETWGISCKEIRILQYIDKQSRRNN